MKNKFYGVILLICLLGTSAFAWKCITWDFQHVGGDAYQLKNLFTSKTLQPLLASDSNQTCDFLPVRGGTYWIRLKGTDLYVTPSDSSGAVNAGIVLAKKKGSPDQLWTIYEQDPQQ